MRTARKWPVFGKTLYAFLLLCAVAVVYGAFLRNPLVFDDLPFFMFEPSLEHLRGFHPFELRWLPYFTLACTTHGIGLDLIWFRLEGLLLHAATGIALFFFLDRLFDLVLKQEEAGQKAIPNVWAAFFGALFFLLHPLAVYGAGYLVQRTIVMATLFSLLALLAYMRGLTEGRRGWLAASVVLYYLAVFSKEHAVMLPAVMLALTLLLREGNDAAVGYPAASSLRGLRRTSAELVRKVWAVFAACAAIALWVVLQKKGVLGSVYEINAPEMIGTAVSTQAAGNGAHAILALSILTQCFLFFKYILLWLLPNPAWLSVDMREPFADSVFSLYLLAVAAFAGYGVLAVRLLLARGKSGLLGFAMLFPWLLFFTEFSVVRIQEPFVLYRSYLWMAGAFAALPIVVGLLGAKRAFIVLPLAAIFLGLLAVDRLTSFSHPFLLWNEAVTLVRDKHDLPGVDRIYYNRGKSFGDLHYYQQALADYQTALALNPSYVPNHMGVASGYYHVGHYPEAVAEFSQVIKMDPRQEQAYYGRGLANEGAGDKAAALADFRRSCELGWKSACAKAHVLRGVP
jgi:tetratricopeptide (TPR) repeat protein